jgi:hypothetical protein
MQCPSCGNEIDAGAKDCDACGSAMPTADVAPATSGERGWGLDAPAMECEGCGAQTVVSTDERVQECPYCGSQKVLEVSADQAADVAAPDRVVRFDLDAAKSGELFRSWVAGLWFAPGDLKQLAEADSIRGVYLPFWSYRVNTQSFCSGQVGHRYKEGEETKTRWERGWTWINNSYDDVLVCASKGVPRNLVEAIEPWDMAKGESYSGAALRGWEVERYAFDEQEAWRTHGKERVEKKERSAAKRELAKRYKAQEVKDLKVDVRYRDLRSEHLLLPVFISAYAYQEKTYRFLINGQTGEVQGERPWSAPKLAALAAGIVAAIAVVVMLASAGGTPPPPASPTPSASPAASPG